MPSREEGGERKLHLPSLLQEDGLDILTEPGDQREGFLEILRDIIAELLLDLGGIVRMEFAPGSGHPAESEERY